MNSNNLVPGSICPKSGEYNVVARNGRIVGTVNVSKGDRMPPTQSKDDHFELA
ncbi:MAG: hypothetical protein IJD07_01785 [Clostridia bacterium]|nr:hypothetical protein [Clostridia bacterium]